MHNLLLGLYSEFAPIAFEPITLIVRVFHWFSAVCEQ